MNFESENQKAYARKRHDRFRDGIIWGIPASLSLFLINPFIVIPVSFIFAAVAGYRGKSIRPALGTILTVFLVAGVGFTIFYISISGINQ